MLGEEPGMRIQGIYAALMTASMERSERFYTQLFERAPDDRPMDGLIQWRNVAGANIQIFRDAEHAGSGRVTIVVPRMEEARASLEKIGVQLADESQGDYGRIAQISDPDGNRITLAEPPSRPFDA
jgi:predicted enzyme related to lactoylglutathione lyase